MAYIEETYPQLSGLQDAYRLDAEGRVAVAEAYEVVRRVHGPLITSITARMLPDLQQDAATGRRIVFLGRDAHSFAAAARALDPGLFADHCSEVVLSRVVADAAVQDLEVHRGARFPEIEGFRATRKRVPPDEVPGAYRRLTAYLRAAGVPVGLPDSAVTLVDSSFKGTVQELIAAAYPQTDFEGRYAFFGAAPDDPNPQRKHGYVVHLAAEETGEGRGWPLDDLHSDPAKTFASKDPINAIEDTLNGPMDTPLRITSGGPLQRTQREDPEYLVGFNPILVPHRYRDPSTREAIKAAALLAVHDAAVEAAAHRTRPGWHESMQQQHERATAEIRAWTERSPQVDPLLKTVLDSMARRTDHPVVSQLQDHLTAAGIPERDAERLWRKLEGAPTRQARADLVAALVRPQVSTAAARGKSKTRHGDGAKKPGAGQQAGHLRRGSSEHEQGRKPPQR
ncbi:ABC transporter permease [Streptomyces sp. NPDC013181]|uniref:ABC transporter permease n=1 Tax=Streptomyces sp. NPDC013181 TaxID=3364864 RepID=UPI0036A732C1